MRLLLSKHLLCRNRIILSQRFDVQNVQNNCQLNDFLLMIFKYLSHLKTSNFEKAGESVLKMSSNPCVSTTWLILVFYYSVGYKTHSYV